ncbi:MAG: hypothetical protein NTY94_18330 [Alphaproteobacteria bacterium]|nr:hypothetical protein [Alphaproteobacteria bacterium]
MAPASLARLLIAFWIVTVVPAVAQEFDGSNGNSYDPLTRAEPAALAASEGRAVRVGGRLLLHAKEQLVVLTDKDDCGDQYWECFGHTFLRHQQDAGAFIVEARGGERSQTLWIDDVTGNATEIGGDPHLSPDRTYFTVVRYWDSAGYSGIQIWRKGGPALEAEYGEVNGDGTSGPRIYAQFVRWLDNNTILLETEWGEPDPPNDVWKSIFGTTTVVQRGGVWALERPPEKYARATECGWRRREGTRQDRTPASWLLSHDRICTDHDASTGPVTRVRNCVFSASASPCENIEIPRVR